MPLSSTRSTPIPASMRFHIPIIILMVAVVYFPALYAEISIIDDLDMVTALLSIENLSLRDIFVPRSLGGGYYRPLLGLSQYIDRQFWMMDSRMMHLENILLHMINSVLVYLLASRLSVQTVRNDRSFVPLATALIFALHPVLTESVVWISGRTDSMACGFILLSALLLFRFREGRKKRDLLFSVAALVVSLFAKEVAFGYVLALPFLILLPGKNPLPRGAGPETPVDGSLRPVILFLTFFAMAVIIVLFGGSYWWVIAVGAGYLFSALVPEVRGRALADVMRQHTLGAALFMFAALATGILFFVVRKIAFTSNIDRISATLHLIFQDTGYAISIFLGAAGFYVKKFVWPLPLNFFILEIDPLYDLLGIAIFLLAIRLVLSRRIIPALCITGICCVLPAFPFAFGTIAWTGYAERYIYIATAFWSIAAAMYAERTLCDRQIPVAAKKVLYAAVVALLIAMAVITRQRTITWQTNLKLIADTVQLSPRQKELRGMYMLAFIRAGDLKAAKEQYRIAATLPGGTYLAHYDLNMAGIAATEGNKVEAETLLQNVVSSTRGNSVAALQFYIKFLENELILGTNPVQIQAIQEKILPLYAKLFLLNKDPFILYRTGQIHIAADNIPEAIRSFEKASRAYPPGNMYGDNSAKIVRKLKHQTESR